jgi:adenylate cyclase
MNEFLSAMTRVVHEYGGTIDKYMGDAMMAFWGAPMENTNHARDALLAAIEMGNALEDVNVRFAEKGWPPIKIGIGLNSGDMHVGNMGSEFRMAYTVLGDAVNLGSRVEGITKNYGVEILVTEFTAQAAPEFDYQRIDSVRVKGKLEPVTLMLPLGVPGEVNQDKMIERDDFHRALDFYLDQSFTQAKPIFKALLQNGKMPVLYQAYVDRCDEFEKNPPGESWDGVFTLTSK